MSRQFFASARRSVLFCACKDRDFDKAVFGSLPRMVLANQGSTSSAWMKAVPDELLKPTKVQQSGSLFISSLELIRVVLMMAIRYPLNLGNLANLLFERGIDLCRETVPHW